MPDDWDQPNMTYNVTNLDIDLLKKEVGQRFPFYDMRSNINAVLFFCRIDKETLDENFESLRKSLSKKGYIPVLRYEKGEHIIQIVFKPKLKKKPVWINLALFIATVFTTTLAGAILWVGIYEPGLESLEFFAKSIEPFYLWNGFIYFSIPLLAILGVHEMGHYFVSKKHNLETSLPFFIPLPPPFILGTFGAIISTHEPIPNRKTLLDVGASGPICGFLVAIPVCIVGLFLMQQNPIPIPADAGGIGIEFPLVMQGLSNLFPITSDVMIQIHPTLFAGWVGCFLTAVNLLPIGQLDGGHIARAVFKEKQKYVSWAVIIAIVALSFFSSGWLFFVIIILFLIGTRHQPPLNEITPLDTKRVLIGILALIIFVLCFAPIPMYG